MSLNDRINILLVDDQPAKLLTYEVILAELGENLIKAQSGSEALRYLLKTEIAVVLIDVCMPDLDGFELARMIREHPRLAKTAIIMVSGVYLSDLDRLKGYHSGAVDYVPVPIIPEVLRAKVRIFADLYRKTEALRSLNEELERRVAQRTADLEASTEQLRSSEQKLREADRRKDEFLAILAHELRNPLSPIQNAIEIMRLRASEHPDATEDKEQIWCREVIERQTSHLTRLVDDLLDVSRITCGKVKLQRSQVELYSVIMRAVEINRPLIDSKNHKLMIETSDRSLCIDGDATRLAQVIGNLLNNAAKYTDRGGVIRLLVTSDQSNGSEPSHAEIRVCDSGIGIPKETLPHVFELFTQGEAGVARSEGGLGIGLALVRNLVEMHGGAVRAISEGPGLGSEFIVRLPLLPSKATSLKSAKVTGLESPTRPRVVLVADDNADSSASLAILLRHSGHEVHTASDGLEAVECGERIRPECVLLDIGMPKMDGYEAARAIRSKSWGREVMLIAQTGWGQDEDRKRTKAAGFDLHLTKPLDHGALLRILSTLPTR